MLVIQGEHQIQTTLSAEQALQVNMGPWLHTIGVGGVQSIAVVVVQESIDRRVVRKTTSKGVKRSVLLNQDHDIGDFAAPVTVGRVHMSLDAGDGAGQPSQGSESEGQVCHCLSASNIILLKLVA